MRWMFHKIDCRITYTPLCALQITKNVSDFIPKREVPAYIRKQKNSKKATEQFQAQIERIVQILVKEYQKSINEYKSVPTPSGMSEELVVCYIWRFDYLCRLI